MLVRTKNLKRYFGKTRAVDDISFEFASGEVVGFVGPNGAGKTTTMRIMATLDEPTGGDVFINGISVVQYPEKAREMVGYMPDSLPRHRDITVDDYLDFFARAFGIRVSRRSSVVGNVEEFTNLRGLKDKFLSDLSKGMKQRVSLARALIHDPSVLVLDEPAGGLDPRARIELRELLKALADQKKAILVSSHILTELSEICDSTIIIEKGNLLRSGKVASILEQDIKISTVRLRCLGEKSSVHKFMLELPGVQGVRLLPDCIEAEVEGGEGACADLLERVVQEGFRVVEFKHIQNGLEDIFMKITKGDLQ
jgi:ABC-2 type transport system ATP-binding protein